ncbi:MAG: helix-turn-helix transcriptional regulator, partial [Lachnospiraceae bacterium]|nr:helix-turn-helix transcriptional regulator [Lachnospiraceae bacterium]
MFEWNETVQKMIYWIEAHLTENPSLLEMSNEIGYSPYYCSNRFHEIVGMTLKSYIAGRRLAMAALEIRDTDERILDIAVKYGYSSQEALTRAFMSAFGCTPAAYRKNPVPIALSNLKVVFFPEHYMSKGEPTM